MIKDSPDNLFAATRSAKPNFASLSRVAFKAVGSVGVQSRLIAQQKRVALDAVMHVANGDGLAVDKAILVNTCMN